jgi:hypothetical protein
VSGGARIFQHWRDTAVAYKMAQSANTMTDIFLSYAREDLRTAQDLAEALEYYGWSVFWDPQSTHGQEIR